MRAGLRDLRLLPAALVAWCVAGLLGMPGAESAAPLVASAAWALAGACCVAAVVFARRSKVVSRRQGAVATEPRGQREDTVSRGRAFLPATAVAAAAAAWPATTVALSGGTEYDSAPDWAMLAEPLRERFRELVVDLPGVGGALLPGLAIGDETMVGPALRESMHATSLTHLTAVSGSNCALVVGAVMVGGALLGVPQRLRIVLALVALAAFVLLVTPQPSVVRAAVMAAFALVGLAAARPLRGMPLLCAAITGILGVVPAAAVELGFVLSALATAGLLVLSGPLADLAARVLPRRLALALAVPVAAQLAVQPAIALVQPTLPTYGVVANLLAVPAAPVGTVLGMLACFLAPVLPEAALGIAWLGWLPAQWIGSVATTFATWPGAALPWPEGPVGMALHAGVLAVAALTLLTTGRRRLLAGMLVLGIGMAYTGALAGPALVAALTRPADWVVAMCDVGQGDAVVVRGGGAVALLDTGPDPGALAACLHDLGVVRVDLLVLSHFDRDHVGGTNAVLGRVDTVLTGPADAASADAVLAPLAAGGARIVAGVEGIRGTLGGAPWRVLWPPARGSPPPGNDASLVWRVDLDAAGTSAVFLGDLGATAQARLLGRDLGGGADVVKVSHHGSADQHADLYAALAPRVAILGVGRDNDYGHPTAAALELLEGLGALIGRTDADGLLLMSLDEPGGLRLWRARAPG
ncbi:MAG TPA: ComEC/Rec2 family competence protein [Microbacteriaceae bacterium]|nr:ComEC/Rec2 family competence protein [Microbacteriaceae bacterium]